MDCPDDSTINIEVASTITMLSAILMLNNRQISDSLTERQNRSLHKRPRDTWCKNLWSTTL